MTLPDHQYVSRATSAIETVFGTSSSNDERIAQPGNVQVPRFYRDEQLLLPQRTQPSANRRPRIVSELLEASSIDEREQLVRRMLRAIGFEWLSYFAVSIQENGHVMPVSFFTSYANREWTERYFSQGYYKLDSRQLALPASGLPFSWDIGSIDAELSDPFSGVQAAAGRARFTADLRTCGIGSGLLFRVGSRAHVKEYTVVSLQSKARRCEWCTDSVVGQGLMLGLSLHEYLSPSPPELSPACVEMPAISSRQQYILELLLQGRSDKEIAHRLELSTHTVDYHMRQLRRRFGARNRVQLASAARRLRSASR